jgi:PKD repeat protein
LPNGVTDPYAIGDSSSISFVVSNGIQPNYTQDFESSTFPPDLRWNIVNSNADCFKWSPASGVSSTGVFTNNIAQMPCYGNASTSNEDFFTPVFLLPCNATAASLVFDVAYRRRSTTSNDQLIVQISTDCGATWTNVYSKSGNVGPNFLYQSATTTGATEYFPAAAGDWRTETINLMPYVSTTSDNIRFRFRGVSANGNNIFIDNVRFLATTPGEATLSVSGLEVLDDGFYTSANTQLGSTTTAIFTMTNTGSTSLIVNNPITVTGTEFALGTGFGSTTLAAGASTTFTVTFSPNSAGSFTGNVSFTTNDCDEGTYNFVLNGTGATSPPVADFSLPTTTICQGSTVTFTNLSTNASTYSWTFAGGTPGTSTATSPSVQYNTAGTYTVTLVATNTYGSDTETKTGYVNVVASTAATLPLTEGFVTATFPLTNWTISNNNNSATTWVRSGTIGAAPTAGNSMMFDNFSFNDADDDEVRVRPISLSGLTASTLTFDVAYAPYNATTFDGLEVLVSTNCGGTWTSVYSKSNTTLATAPATTAIFTPTAAQWRTETVSLTPYVGQGNVIVAFRNLSGYGNRLFVDNVNITGSVTATANFTMNPNPVCQGQTVTFTNTSVGATSWSWNFGAGATPAAATGSGPHTVTYSSAGSKTVTLQINGTGPTSSQVLTVNALPATPTITAGGPTTFCAGGSVTLTASAGSSYLWSTGATTQSINVTTAGTYTVQVTNASGCQSAASVGTTVTVNAVPAAPTITAGGPTTFCVGDSVTLSSSAGDSYLWSDGSTTQSISANTAGIYTVIVTNSSGCSSPASSSTSVTVNPLPATPTISAGGPTTFCVGGSVTLTSSAAGSYLWSDGSITQSITVLTTGTYTVIVSDGICSSLASSAVDVTVVSNPSTPVITASGPLTFCSGDSVVLSSSATSGNSWSSGETTQDITVSSSGIYTVSVGVSGCSTSSAPINVVVNTNPIVTFGAINDMCVYNNSLVLNQGSPSGGTYSGTGVTAGQFDPATAGTGTFTLTYDYTDANGCSGSAESQVLVDECASLEESDLGYIVYPNPANDLVIVDNVASDATIEMYDSFGKLVNITVEMSSEKAHFSVNHLAVGVYQLRITTGGTVSTISLSVSH